MKKIFIIICALFVGIANADNVITSKEYVDTQGATLQPEISAKNTNTVLTYPAAGTDVPGEKAIYDASAAYGAQTDALVTAGQFNNALQVALDTEFVCVSRNDQGCLLYEIRAARPHPDQLPNGYTRLEYIESTGKQYIDTLVIPQYGDCVTSSLIVTEKDGSYRALFGATPNGFDDKFYVSVSTRGDYFANHSIGKNKLQLNTKYNISVCLHQDMSGLLTINGKNVASEKIDLESLNLYVFTRNSHEPRAVLKQYTFQVSRNNGLIFNGIPARRDSDDEVGMYDLVSGTFFTNSGTGEFIAGPVVSSNLYLSSGN